MIISRLSNDLNDKKHELAGCSCLQMTDNRGLTVENCFGVLTYNENLIKLRLSGNYLIIVGTGFKLTNFSNNGIIVSGEIHSLEFEKIVEKRRK